MLSVLGWAPVAKITVLELKVSFSVATKNPLLVVCKFITSPKIVSILNNFKCSLNLA